jgi:hypothetical protein
MTCKCGSERLASTGSKHNDAFSLSVPHLDISYHGYAPYIAQADGSKKLFGGDYTRFTFCLDCGQIQNFAPIADETLIEATERVPR